MGATPAEAKTPRPAVAASGLTGWYSHVSNNAPNDSPDTSSAYATKSPTAAFPCVYLAGHPFRISKNGSSPISLRSACSASAPRSYTARWNWFSGPGSPGSTVQKGASAGCDAYTWPAISCAVPSFSCSDRSHCAYRAKPSLIQMSFHPATETRSPYHWWASSWTTTDTFDPFAN